MVLSFVFISSQEFSVEEFGKRFLLGDFERFVGDFERLVGDLEIFDDDLWALAESSVLNFFNSNFEGFSRKSTIFKD